ncbi:hypothetical protein [Rhodococcus sp. AG1013]|uniref:hypothetical protein n=1 Tax=Rhodococcus sp. AG1013 TaxID=2183996 RepID=UPI0011C02592|nr:hypothetical protein [Rhodococcus sp. AG1013]
MSGRPGTGGLTNPPPSTSCKGRPRDAGNRYTSIFFSETLVLEGIAAPIGSIGDAYDKRIGRVHDRVFEIEAMAKNNPPMTVRSRMNLVGVHCSRSARPPQVEIIRGREHDQQGAQ